MNLEIGPIFRALMKNKIGAALIALQIAVTMTVLANGFFIIESRKELMARDTGIDLANSFTLNNFGYAPEFNMASSREFDLDFIRQIPSVIEATSINAIPVSGSGWSMSLQTEAGPEADDIGTAVYMVDDKALKTLDVELIAGENFTPNELSIRNQDTANWPSSTILTQALVEMLWPDQPIHEAVGKTVYIDDTQPMIVKGVIDKLQAPWIGWNNVENVMLSPEKLEFPNINYFVRTEPGTLESVMEQVEDHLTRSTPGRFLDRFRTMQSIYDRSYRQDAGMITILTTIMIILTVITALGIVGLASFSVNRRKKQIGTRRALGATKGAIIRYFMVENFVISSFGVCIGAILTIGLNIVLVNYFSLNSIDWYYIPISMLSLWLVGLLAVYGPAKRASTISPATATRST